MQVQPNTDGSVTLHQASYIDKMAKLYLGTHSNMKSFKNPSRGDLPELVEAALGPDAEPPTAEQVTSFQSFIGALLYAAVSTRPDIAYPVGMLCRAMAKPTPELFAAAEQVLIYLVGTKDIGVTFDASDTEPILSGRSDSNWATRHSTTGYIFSVFNGAISWVCKKQPTIALSSTEAEIVSASASASEAVYLRTLLEELGFPQSEPTELRVDNQGVVFAATYPGHSHTKMKHVERRHFFVRELVQNGKLNVTYISTDDNVADIFTKPLATKRFKELRDKAMNIKQRTPST